jgi:hypothetical protein
MRTVLATAVVVLAPCACGGGDAGFAPGVGNDPGTGTGTLVVQGAIMASPGRFNAPARRDFETVFSLRVSRNNRPVANGTVTIASATGKVPLTYDLGRWIGSAASYDEVYVLDIASGADRVDSVRIDGPDVHTFSQPLPGSTVPSNMPVTIEWRRAVEADGAAVRTETTDWIEIPDAGSYALPAGALKGEGNRIVPHTVRLARTNRLVPAGAAAGSSWSVTIENQLNVNTEAIPPL